MNIFGCKFCKYIELKNTKELEFECSRKNFDSLLWATLTVFQVIGSALIGRQVVSFVVVFVHTHSFVSMGVLFDVVIDVHTEREGAEICHRNDVAHVISLFPTHAMLSMYFRDAESHTRCLRFVFFSFKNPHLVFLVCIYSAVNSARYKHSI